MLDFTLKDTTKISLIQNDLIQSIAILEEAIQSSPNELTNYWYLGLAYLLQGEEEAAQLVWLGAIAEQGEENSNGIVQSLVQILTTAAERLTSIHQIREAWVIRGHIREFVPQDLTNLIFLVDLSIELDELTDESVEDLGIIELLLSGAAAVDLSILDCVFEKILRVPAASTLSFAEACLLRMPSREQWAEKIVSAAIFMAFQRRLTRFGVALLELCLQHEPTNILAIGYLSRLYSDCGRHSEAIEAAKQFCQRCQTLETQLFSTCFLFQALMKAGDWREIPEVGNQLKAMLSELNQDQHIQLSLSTVQALAINIGLFVYLKDNLVENRKLQNQVSQLFLKNIEANQLGSIKSTSAQRKSSKERLKIGYIASTLKAHSVGWLSRWIFQHHNHDEFELSAYLVNQNSENEFFKTWFAPHLDYIRPLPVDIVNAVNIIREDKLDILVDLDSVTLDVTFTIMALKPAPIQVTWLGCDASGLPTIDYFIADPYVLPHKAQDCYQENIWRLPQTYIAVEGFEIGVPTLQRTDLNIPEDAVVYWSSQAGFKRNLDTVRLQMQIMREVPNSYFLIKGLGDQDLIHDFFIRIAEEEGVFPDQLKFLPMAEDEYTHRANLQIADVVLDTYPYNGATTTLETLWMGIPLVTRVGEQFAARNSYAFMKNAGIEEGIAWTDEEYVEWGIRLGQDEKLRQQVTWKLHQSRKTSPLWNAKQFTREMEDAYRSMWALHLEQQ